MSSVIVDLVMDFSILQRDCCTSQSELYAAIRLNERHSALMNLTTGFVRPCDLIDRGFLNQEDLKRNIEGYSETIDFLFTE
jgi:hypothetical protein